MDINQLKAQHQSIGKTLDSAESALPFNAIQLAKKAARQSHDLMGGIIEKLERLEIVKANDPMAIARHSDNE